MINTIQHIVNRFNNKPISYQKAIKFLNHQYRDKNKLDYTDAILNLIFPENNNHQHTTSNINTIINELASIVISTEISYALSNETTNNAFCNDPLANPNLELVAYIFKTKHNEVKSQFEKIKNQKHTNALLLMDKTYNWNFNYATA